jgi:hypothetical protein
VAPDDQPAGRLYDLSWGRELRGHRSSRHAGADYRGRARNSRHSIIAGGLPRVSH